MKTLKISVTDENGVLLDATQIQVNDDISTLAISALRVGQCDPLSQAELEIGVDAHQAMNSLSKARQRAAVAKEPK